MKPYRLPVVLALALGLAMVVGSGRSKPARADACRHADVVLYTTDTRPLAAELSKFASACADYYVSITPNGSAPRGGAVVTALHALGSHFHALAEVRLPLWASYADANGWYATGVEVRREMRAVGYDAAKGDAWALNEVGAPSTAAMAVDVLKGNGTARTDLRDFVRGLFTGDDGVPEAGLVFAADPVHATTDLSQYEQDLAAWYGDTPFWTDMAKHVKFWAQETYADARAWGVAGSGLAERSAYLNDYFLHGIRLAQREDGRTGAARAFFANAYTPVGNAAFRWGAPVGIGFGYTDIGLFGMQNFVSTQTYAVRLSSGGRFGFAVVPRSSPAAETLGVYDRLAAAIRDSETQPSGACGASGEWCDSTVPDARFNDAWKAFANTLEGAPRDVRPAPGVTVTYAAVTARGSTWVETSAPSSGPPPRFYARPGALAYDLATTASVTGPIGVCIAYDPDAYAGYAPHLFQLGSEGWNDVTTSVGPSAVCGSVEALGTFAVFATDPTPPVIAPTVEGPVGDNGWYTGDVTVTWSVVEPQSPESLVTSGCEPTTITADTGGTTLTCTATSDGGTSSASVTVKRDATPPAVECVATPSTLWPPNGKLVPVDVAVTVSDDTAGAAGFVLDTTTVTTGDSERDIVGFDIGTPDGFGFLRAERRGNERARVYSLAYTAHDLAGNAAGCEVRVVVPHDRRS
jgi:hypothetical protein